jgi:hypothetical protein
MEVRSHTITKEKRRHGDHGTRKIPQVIGAEKAGPARDVVSMPGDGGFTMLMGDFVHSLSDCQAVMNRHTDETSDLAKTSL